MQFISFSASYFMHLIYASHAIYHIHPILCISFHTCCFMFKLITSMILGQELRELQKSAKWVWAKLNKPYSKCRHLQLFLHHFTTTWRQPGLSRVFVDTFGKIWDTKKRRSAEELFKLQLN